jgi:hypothetical protein
MLTDDVMKTGTPGVPISPGCFSVACFALSAHNLAEAFYEFEICLKCCGNRFQGKTQDLFLLLALHLLKNRFYQDPRISRRPGTKTKRLV